MLNTVCLIIDEPGLKETYTIKTVAIINFFIVIYYIIEVLIRIFAMGFLKGKSTFIKDNFNLFDLFLVFTICIIMIVEY